MNKLEPKGAPKRAKEHSKTPLRKCIEYCDSWMKIDFCRSFCTWPKIYNIYQLEIDFLIFGFFLGGGVKMCKLKKNQLGFSKVVLFENVFGVFEVWDDDILMFLKHQFDFRKLKTLNFSKFSNVRFLFTYLFIYYYLSLSL